jgi:hypothetical protein
MTNLIAGGVIDANPGRSEAGVAFNVATWDLDLDSGWFAVAGPH